MNRFSVVVEDGAIVALQFGGSQERSALADEFFRQFEEYADGRRRQFDLPLRPKGSPFQKLVWEALLTIPYGETRSYGEIARLIGKPGRARAVGRANATNPIPILIPCHRVIGSDGSLTGYGGGLDLKTHLLHLEGITFSGGRVRLAGRL